MFAHLMCLRTAWEVFMVPSHCFWRIFLPLYSCMRSPHTIIFPHHLPQPQKNADFHSKVLQEWGYLREKPGGGHQRSFREWWAGCECRESPEPRAGGWDQTFLCAWATHPLLMWLCWFVPFAAKSRDAMKALMPSVVWCARQEKCL